MKHCLCREDCVALGVEKVGIVDSTLKSKS
jgi:hypothetical protein